jgi:hypothetical protein
VTAPEFTVLLGKVGGGMPVSCISSCSNKSIPLLHHTLGYLVIYERDVPFAWLPRPRLGAARMEVHNLPYLCVPTMADAPQPPVSQRCMPRCMFPSWCAYCSVHPCGADAFRPCVGRNVPTAGFVLRVKLMYLSE